MTVPFVDPMFGKVYARELALSAVELLAEHSGNDDYLAPAETEPGDGRPHSSPGPVSGRAAVDVEALTMSAESSVAAPPTEPGRSSLSLEQLEASARIAFMCADHRARAAERVRLDDLAHAQEWLS